MRTQDPVLRHREDQHRETIARFMTNFGRVPRSSHRLPDKKREERRQRLQQSLLQGVGGIESLQPSLLGTQPPVTFLNARVLK
jgi:hypothetical protein